MSQGPNVLNGIRPDGSYAYTRPDDAEVARWLEPAAPPPKSNLRGVARGVDANDLTSAGWAVLYPPGERDRLEPLLQDLLDLRREQAGDLFQSIELYPNEPCDLFLERVGANTGKADPHRLPYYLLLAGDPGQIDFAFQGRLDQVYAVGRLSFDRDEHYASYAAAVREAETDPPWKPRRRITLFGAQNGVDPATRRTTEHLIEPLAEGIAPSLATRPGWQVERIVGPDATRDRLAALLTGKDAPDVLFTASHGMVFDQDDPRQRALQGALLCSDWPGPGHPLTRDTYLAAEDLQIEGRPLHGTVTFHLACHSGGTPVWDSFRPPEAEPKRLAQNPFVAALPQRLLGDAGALAVIAHVDRAWTTSFDWAPQDEQPDPGAFQETVLPLVYGHRVGDATEGLGAFYGQLAAHVKETWDLERSPTIARTRSDPTHIARLWRATNDIRSFVVFGDPAVRVGGGEGTSTLR